MTRIDLTPVRAAALAAGVCDWFSVPTDAITEECDWCLGTGDDETPECCDERTCRHPVVPEPGPDGIPATIRVDGAMPEYPTKFGGWTVVGIDGMAWLANASSPSLVRIPEPGTVLTVTLWEALPVHDWHAPFRGPGIYVGTLDHHPYVVHVDSESECTDLLDELIPFSSWTPGHLAVRLTPTT